MPKVINIIKEKWKQISGALIALFSVGGGVYYGAEVLVQPTEQEIILENFENATDKKLFKAKELAKQKFDRVNDIDFEKDNIKIKIETLTYTTSGAVEAIISAKRDGKELRVNNPYLFYNPPLKVPDGTKKIEILKDGTEILVDNFEVNPKKALEEIIIQTIKSQNP